HLHDHPRPNTAKDMQGIWDDTMEYLREAKHEENVHVKCTNQQDKDPTVSFSPFSRFIEPTRLVFGHHHDPRIEGNIYDVGGFSGLNRTFLSVRADGSIDRNP